MDSFSQYILNQAGHFSKIIYGTDKIKKIEKVYTTYRIYSSEKILAYIKNTLPFIGLNVDGTIITNQAIYFDPSHKDWAPSNRFAFSEICGYVFTMENDKASVMAENTSGSFQIMNGTLLGKNVGGCELIQLIEEVQASLTSSNSWALQQRDAVVDHVKQVACSDLQKGRLSSHSINLLNSISKDSRYLTDSLIIKAEDIYRTFDIAQFNLFLQNHSQLSSLSSDLSKRFEKNFIDDLKSIYVDFDKDFLKETSNNLSKIENVSSVQQWIIGYIHARLDNNSSFQNTCSAINQIGGDNASIPLIKFRCCYMNQKMRKVLDAIQTSGEIPNEWIGLIDNLGLTPLHYALILHKKETASKLLDKYEWKVSSPAQDYDVFDYTVLACYLNLDNCEEVYCKTSQDVAALLRSKKSLENRVWLKKKRLSLQETLIRQTRNVLHTAKRQGGDYNRILEVQDKLNELINANRELKIEIEELQQDISEIDFEIKDTIQSGLANARNKAQQFANESDVFICHLRHIFSDAAFLSHVLNVDPDNCILYTHRSITFTVPNDVELGKAYSGYGGFTDDASSSQSSYSQNSTKQNSPITKPYGNSWFSPEAHHNMKILREEYHALAKQYHPDLCNHIRSKEIFQEILNERADILDSMPT